MPIVPSLYVPDAVIYRDRQIDTIGKNWTVQTVEHRPSQECEYCGHTDSGRFIFLKKMN